MRKVEIAAVEAFKNGKNLSRGNTVVSDGVVYLHGNPIVRRRAESVEFSMCGWGSVTTRSRLNAFLPNGFGVFQKNYTQFLSVPSGDAFEIDPDESVVIYPDGTFYLES